MRILVVEDDPFVAKVITRGLTDAHYAVDHAPDGELGLELASVNDYDVIVLNILLPKRTGFDVCRDLRERRSVVPILMLTALEGDESQIKGLDCGADDYLNKPFSIPVLLAHVRALARRESKQKTSELRVGSLIYDTASRIATCDGETLDLTAKEQNLLEYFMRNAEEVLTREMISEHVWDMNFDPQSNVVDSLVRRLRYKLGRSGRTVIVTVRGVGYRLTEAANGVVRAAEK
jgi:DNA-binding response OmpR family regulator